MFSDFNCFEEFEELLDTDAFCYYLKVEKKFESARTSLDLSLKKLKTGKVNLISQVERIKLLGITMTKNLSTSEAKEEDETGESVI